MANKPSSLIGGGGSMVGTAGSAARGALGQRALPRPSSPLDSRVIYCGDNLEQLKNLPDECIDLIYIDPPINSNRNCEGFWGETREKGVLRLRDHANTAAYIDYMRPLCLQLSRVR